VAQELADVLFTVNGETRHAEEFTWATLGAHATILAADEELDSPRIRAATGPGNAFAYHVFRPACIPRRRAAGWCPA